MCVLFCSKYSKTFEHRTHQNLTLKVLEYSFYWLFNFKDRKMICQPAVGSSGACELLVTNIQNQDWGRLRLWMETSPPEGSGAPERVFRFLLDYRLFQLFLQELLCRHGLNLTVLSSKYSCFWWNHECDNFLACFPVFSLLNTSKGKRKKMFSFWNRSWFINEKKLFFKNI